MAYDIIIPNGILSMVETDFICPNCGYPYEEKDYYRQLENSKQFLIHKKCQGCKKWIGITSNIKGDTVVWMKETEKNYLLIRK